MSRNKHNFKPGDVAIRRSSRPSINILVGSCSYHDDYAGPHWHGVALTDGAAVHNSLHSGMAGVVYEPVAVLDPGSRESVERLSSAYERSAGLPQVGSLHDASARRLQVALEALLPERVPERISQPGLWAVVEARQEGWASRARYVRIDCLDSPWRTQGRVAMWHDLIDPTLVRPGVDD